MIFYKTGQCYNYLKEYLIKALHSYLDTELEYLHYECEGRVAEDPARWSDGHTYVTNDKAINNALREIGPNCSFYDYERMFYDDVAKKHGLLGGESNRCLQNFVVRFNEYSEKAFKAFLTEVHKYLVQDLTLYGMWLSLTRTNETERIRRKAWVTENIAVLSEQLLAAREVFKEAAYGGSAFPYVNVTEVEAILTDIMTKNASNLD